MSDEKKRTADAGEAAEAVKRPKMDSGEVAAQLVKLTTLSKCMSTIGEISSLEVQRMRQELEEKKGIEKELQKTKMQYMQLVHTLTAIANMLPGFLAPEINPKIAVKNVRGKYEYVYPSDKALSDKIDAYLKCHSATTMNEGKTVVLPLTLKPCVPDSDPPPSILEVKFKFTQDHGEWHFDAMKVVQLGVFANPQAFALKVHQRRGGKPLINPKFGDPDVNGWRSVIETYPVYHGYFFELYHDRGEDRLSRMHGIDQTGDIIHEGYFGGRFSLAWFKRD